MKIEEILFVEKDGIINTINDYTREHYIKNYTTLLREMTYPRDRDKLIIITYRLLEWYDKNYQIIIDNEYINNKHEHKESHELLKELINQLLE